MSKRTLQTPVVLPVFNRPGPTRQVFAAIRTARPTSLIILADGPRSHVSHDAENCAATRAIVEAVDWPCELIRIYSPTNMGCARRVSSGLDEVFERFPAAIILEDDCVPDPTFFRWCDELLEHYEDDERVMCISGDNFQFGRRRSPYSYYFSLHTHIWGWATWRRAWHHYDFDMVHWPEMRDNGWLRDVLGSKRHVDVWTRIFEAVYSGQINSWAYRWTFACWSQSGLTVLPSRNLVSNIGFGGEATHTRSPSKFANLATESMPFPLSHPYFVVRDVDADNRTMEEVFVPKPLARRIASRILRLTNRS